MRGLHGLAIDIPRTAARIESCKDIEMPISMDTQSANRVDSDFFKSSHCSTLNPRRIVDNKGSSRKPLDLPKNRDFLFESETVNGRYEASVYAHMPDHDLTGVQIKNEESMVIVDGFWESQRIQFQKWRDWCK